MAPGCPTRRPYPESGIGTPPAWPAKRMSAASEAWEKVGRLCRLIGAAGQLGNRYPIISAALDRGCSLEKIHAWGTDPRRPGYPMKPGTLCNWLTVSQLATLPPRMWG